MTNSELIDLWRTKHKIDQKQPPTLLELMDLCERARIAGLEAAENVCRLAADAHNEVDQMDFQVMARLLERHIRKMKGTV